VIATKPFRLTSLSPASASVTRWGTQPIREAQTSLVASRSSDSTPVASSEFAADALSAGSITLLAAGSASLSGRVIATSGALQINVAGDLQRSMAPSQTAATADDAEAALALLQSPRPSASSPVPVSCSANAASCKPRCQTARTPAPSHSPQVSTPSSPVTCSPQAPCPSAPDDICCWTESSMLPATSQPSPAPVLPTPETSQPQRSRI
jgi:hypothetical protein